MKIKKESESTVSVKIIEQPAGSSASKHLTIIDATPDAVCNLVETSLKKPTQRVRVIFEDRKGVSRSRSITIHGMSVAEIERDIIKIINAQS